VRRSQTSHLVLRGCINMCSLQSRQVSPLPCLEICVNGNRREAEFKHAFDSVKKDIHRLSKTGIVMVRIYRAGKGEPVLRYPSPRAELRRHASKSGRNVEVREQALKGDAKSLGISECWPRNLVDLELIMSPALPMWLQQLLCLQNLHIGLCGTDLMTSQIR